MQVQKVNVLNKTYFKYLDDDATKGKYVCVLTDIEFCSQHSVGIDCDSFPKMIWYCCEKKPMELSRTNLDTCVGGKDMFLEIKIMGLIKRYT